MNCLIAVLFVIWWGLLLAVLLPPRSFRDVIRGPRDTEWNHRCLGRIYLIGLVVNLVLAPGLSFGVAPMVQIYTAAVFVLLLVRLIVARVRHETGKGWLFYAVLIWFSPIWIPLVALIPCCLAE